MGYKILCEVWGGVTGSRQGWLKDNGKEVVFKDKVIAEAEARRLRRNVSPYATASFAYTVYEVSDELS